MATRAPAVQTLVERPPVLCYHRVGGPLELGVTRVARPVFERQMRTLARAGWRTLSLQQFSDAIVAPSSASRNRFLLTFDDGYASLADFAYPVLAELGFTATTFLITDYVGSLNTWDVRYTWRRLSHLDWRAIEHWHGRGFDFGSHGASHVRLTWLGDSAVRDELGRSRGTLCQRLGAESGRAIAYPFGAWDERIEALAAVAGYELSFGGGRGGRGVRSRSLPRLPVYVWDRGSVPFGLRNDGVGALGRTVARVASRCAVGTSWMLKLRRADGAPRATG